MCLSHSHMNYVPLPYNFVNNPTNHHTCFLLCFIRDGAIHRSIHMCNLRVVTRARARVRSWHACSLGDADIGLEKHFGTLNGVDGRTDGRRDRRRRLRRGRQRNRQRARERTRTLDRSLAHGALSSSVGDAGRVKYHPRRSGQRERERGWRQNQRERCTFYPFSERRRVKKRDLEVKLCEEKEKAERSGAHWIGRVGVWG